MIISYTNLRKIAAYSLIAFSMFVSSGASTLANDKNVIVGGWLFFTLIYFYFEPIIKQTFLILTGLFVVVSVLYYLLNGALNAVTYLGLFMRIYLAYYCRDLCKDDFADYFVRFIYVLTCISLVMFVLQLINFDLMFNLNKIFVTESHYRTVKSNSIIFTMVPIHAFRNCGFMWEPGAFVTVLLLTFYINLFHLGESLTSRKNIVFLIAIMTTSSTMGIMGLLIPFSFLLKDFVVKNRTYQQLSVVIIPAVLIVCGVIFTQVDFLYKKMVAEILELDDELREVEKGGYADYVVSVTRSASVILDWRTIKRYPFFGLGVDMRTTGFKKLGYSEKLETSCGSTILILRFGFIGFILYSILLYRAALFDSVMHKVGWVLLVNYALFTQEISASTLFHFFVF
jgi:hypothetical protein